MLIKCYATVTILKKIFFSIPTRTVQPRLSVSTVLHAVPGCVIVLTLHNPVPPSHLVPDAGYYVYVNVSPVAAVVTVGKGRKRKGSTQIGRMVSDGKRPPDQTKSTNAIRSVSEDPGREW